MVLFAYMLLFVLLVMFAIHIDAATNMKETMISLQATLIRQIQSDEGNASCYATAIAIGCPRKECRWGDDCFEDAVDIHFQQLQKITNGSASIC